MKRFLIIASLLLAAAPAHAARLYFTPIPSAVGVGDTFPLTLMLDPQGADVNAVDGVVLLSDGLTIAGIREDNSIVPLWVTRPTIEGGRTSTFSGVIPGGFSGVLSPFWEGGHPGALYTLEIEATQPGSARVTVGPGLQILANDGKGTQLPATAEDAVFAVGQQPTRPADNEPQDTEPPEDFTPVVGRSADLFDNAYFLAFATEDTGSGIDHYEVAESRSHIPASSASFVRVESPYRLHDQSLGSYLYVRAVDRAGNATVAVVPPAHASVLRTYLWLLLPLVLLLAYGAFILLRKRYPYAH
ncbi:MAG TPA: hypothetical protein VJW73_22445 [Gemmatimonadaceae bacterium]|nr:hypothetical protein [Gemmatimonadaceae bacterium]